MIPQSELDRQKAIIDAATPEPWVVDRTVALGAYGVWNHPEAEASPAIHVCTVIQPQLYPRADDVEVRDAHATLIAASRTCWPQCRDEVARLQGVLREIKGEMKRAGNPILAESRSRIDSIFARECL